jgi:hypothetical protein
MNNHWRVVVRVGLALVLGFGAIRSTDAAGTQVLTLNGTVTNSSGQSLPGCLLSVVSELGRSAPAFTDGKGGFSLETSLPPGASSELFLEIYWNRTLMFRQPLASLAIASATPNNRGSPQGATWQGLLSDGGTVVLQPIKLGK